MKTINFKGQALETKESGSVNSSGGRIMSAFVPELNDYIRYRQNGDRGERGFHFQDAIGNETKSKHGYKAWTISKDFSLS